MISKRSALLPAAASAAPERTVAVTAKATVKVPNDQATFGIGVKPERRTRGAALQATSAELRKVIVAVQKVKGVGPGDIVTGRVSMRPVKRGSVTIYRGREGAKVSLHEPANSGTLVAKALAAPPSQAARRCTPPSTSSLNCSRTGRVGP